MKNILARILLLAAFLFGAIEPSFAASPYDSLGVYAGTTGGTANAQTGTIPNLTKLSAGLIVRVTWGVANTGALQYNLSGFGLKSVLAHDGTGLNSGDAAAGRTDTLLYNGTSWIDLDWAGQKLSTDLTDSGTAISSGVGISAPIVNSCGIDSGFVSNPSVNLPCQISNSDPWLLVVADGVTSNTGNNGVYILSYWNNGGAPGTSINRLSGSNDDTTVSISAGTVTVSATGTRNIHVGMQRLQ